MLVDLLPIDDWFPLNSFGMKNWAVAGCIGLALIVSSCQPREENASLAPSTRQGSWVVYPPLSDSELARKTHLPLATIKEKRANERRAAAIQSQKKPASN